MKQAGVHGRFEMHRTNQWEMEGKAMNSPEVPDHRIRHGVDGTCIRGVVWVGTMRKRNLVYILNN